MVFKSEPRSVNCDAFNDISQFFWHVQLCLLLYQLHGNTIWKSLKLLKPIFNKRNLTLPGLSNFFHSVKYNATSTDEELEVSNLFRNVCTACLHCRLNSQGTEEAIFIYNFLCIDIYASFITCTCQVQTF